MKPKSADALKILPHLNRLDFIELKGFQKFIQYDKEKNFQKKIEGFDLEGKIKDSLLVLDLVVKDKSICFTKHYSRLFIT